MTDSGFTSEKERDALRAAHLYYMQDLTMEAIASELHTSRSSVSRLLGFARETGLVEIQVKNPVDRISSVQDRIRDRHGVTAHVVPVPDSTAEVDRLERVAMSTARILGPFFDSNMTMGIAWGSTISAVSRHLQEKVTHNSQIVQLNGAANTRTTGIGYASEIMSRFGTAYGAYVQQFPVPAFFDDPRTKEVLWRERSIRRVLEIQKHMDIALFGLGSAYADVPSHVYVGGYLDDADFEQLTHSAVVGDVATVFYRADGSSEDIPMNARSSGPSLALLKKVSRRVCVVSGRSKLPALHGALAAGVMTDLIIDEATAHSLLEG
ncbi:sugar-binding transcriptional regulator [Herbiconiux moechotypicola]|uniref:Sugar-binding domain-containing protein n=1 Tax=Herbiconiux moechotypicola TaxID=637393 RepID=A0ABN3DZR7_9MICO|nr:sugar-binding domain-containing protein [Herbiconiux moechotypicola]MCS5730901.1 sugar-binding transcriptional regulator [Herbiconiux moechotypicola]